MEKGHDDKAETALRQQLRSLVLAADARETTLHLTPQEVEALVNRLLLCAGDEPAAPVDEQTLRYILQNGRQADDAFIDQIIANKFAESRPRYDPQALRAAVKPHVQSCVCLNRTPANFTPAVEMIIRNYLFDGELVEVLKRRLSSSSYHQLIEAIQGYLKAAALDKFHRKAQEADDLVQDTWVKLLAQLDDFHFLSRFRVWAVTILYRTHCDEIRRRNQEKTGGKFKHLSWQTPIAQDDSTLTIGDTIATPAANPEDELLFKELWDFVSAYIEQQKDELRQAIGELAILEQAKPEDIAAELKMPAQKVYVHLFKIRQKLRQNPGIEPAA